MSVTNLSWGDGGGDYSFLMDSIEGKIATAGAVKNHTAKKRSRLSIDRNDFDQDDDDNTIQNYSSGLKSLAKIDELKIENETLIEQLANLKTENSIARDKMLKKIIFLEDQNNKLRKDAELKSEHYHEEKKKLQSKVRECEFQLSKIAVAAPTPSLPLANSNSDKSEEITNRLKMLEREVNLKSKEVKDSAVTIINLETKVFQLQQEIKLHQTLYAPSSGDSMGVDSVYSVESGEMKELKRQKNDLEMSLKRKTRDIEKLEQKLKNQQLLEEYISSLTSELKVSQERVRQGEATQSKCQKLVDEKASWKTMFQSIMTSSGGSGAEKEVTPLNILRILSSSQEKCSLLLKTQGELELQISDLQSKLRKSDGKLHEAELSHKESLAIANTLTKKTAILSQQVSIYADEVTSLRGLLQTYDVEFSIGRPDLSKAVELKEQVISSLRTELDKVRETANGLSKQLLELQHGSTTNPSTSSKPVTAETAGHISDAATLAELRDESEMLKMELRALQEITGMDFVPGKTKVLHMVHNPHSAVSRAPVSSTVPMDELRRLRQQNKQLSAAIAAASTQQQPEAVAEQQQDANQSMLNLTVMKGSGGNSGSSGASSSAADSSKLNLRLKEMFKERITAFREAVYLLTGYKIDLYTSEPGSASGGSALPRLRLRSMYSEKPEDSLLFQWKGDALELLDTEFASRLDTKLFAYLTSCNSVPAFLANVTIDLFESQTFLG